jgi:low affinity Fe/Cu permease
MNTELNTTPMAPIHVPTNDSQLMVNTGTDIVIFLMVFLIQNTQNRDSREIHLKLDELICAQRAQSVIALESLTDEERQDDAVAAPGRARSQSRMIVATLHRFVLCDCDAQRTLLFSERIDGCVQKDL